MASTKVDRRSLSTQGSSRPAAPVHASSADHLVYLQETQQTSRPLTHRPSVSSAAAAAGTIAPRQGHSRNNSHSVLSGSLNASHRVSRRKSMTGSSASAAAVAAAVKEATGDGAAAVPIAGARRNTVSKPGVSRSSLLVGSLPSPSAASLPTHKFVALNGKLDLQGSAIDDLNDASDGEGAQKARVRRASDGQPLKEGRKMNRVELRCETCGKGYKHSSCLTKHLFVPTLLPRSWLPPGRRPRRAGRDPGPRRGAGGGAAWKKSVC